MIVDAIVMARGSNEHTWKVAIPLFGGFPDSEDEASIYNKIKGMESLEDYYGNPIAAAAATLLPSTATVVALNDVVKAKKDKKDIADVREYTRVAFNTVVQNDDSSDTSTDFTVEATVCETPGLAGNIKIGDTVYVGFYKGDMGNPIILGHRWHASPDTMLPSYARNYDPPKPNIDAKNLTADGQVILSSNSTFKDSTGAEMTFSQIRDAVNFYNTYKDLIVSLTTNAEALILLASKSAALVGSLTPTTPTT